MLIRPLLFFKFAICSAFMIYYQQEELGVAVFASLNILVFVSICDIVTVIQIDLRCLGHKLNANKLYANIYLGILLAVSYITRNLFRGTPTRISIFFLVIKLVRFYTGYQHQQHRCITKKLSAIIYITQHHVYCIVCISSTMVFHYKQAISVYITLNSIFCCITSMMLCWCK